MIMHQTYSTDKLFENSTIFLMFCAAMWLVVFPIYDYDTFWHLANGRAMLAEGRIINEEIFSYSAYGTHFANHSWLAQILMYLVFSFAGSAGLIIAKVFAAFLVFNFIFIHARNLGSSPILAGMAGFSVIYVGISRFTVRPQIFSYVALAALIVLLNGYLNREWRDRSLWVLPPLIIVWDFMHGAAFGYVYWVALLIGASLQIARERFLKKEENNSTKKGRIIKLSLVLLVTMALSLLKPYGFELYSNLFALVGDSYIVRMTAEFKPTPLEGFLPFWILIFLAAIFMIIDWRRVQLHEVLVFLPFAYLGIRYNRCVAVSAIVAAPLAAVHGMHCLNVLRNFFCRGHLGKALPIFLLVISIYSTVYLKVFKPGKVEFVPNVLQSGLGINQNFLPLGAIDFIKQTNLQGQMFNSDRFGGLLAFYAYPERPIFHYNHPAIFTEIYSFLHNPRDRSKWQHEYAVVGNPEEVSLFQSLGWVTVYRDLSSMVMVRPTGVNSEVAMNNRMFLFNPFMTKEAFVKVLSHPSATQQLLKETATYLNFNQDKRVVGLFCDGLSRNLHWLGSEENRALVEKALLKNPQESILLGLLEL
jgi:hypothetical protein